MNATKIFLSLIFGFNIRENYNLAQIIHDKLNKNKPNYLLFPKIIFWVLQKNIHAKRHEREKMHAKEHEEKKTKKEGKK